jgi:hypothetical protein
MIWIKKNVYLPVLLENCSIINCLASTASLTCKLGLDLIKSIAVKQA